MEGLFDFSGWATRNDLLCSDGRTIRRDAFKHNDGNKVPLVWNHQHGGSENVLGHALLENRPEGVYVYGTFNETESGQNAKMLVQHGDVDKLSIYANRLRQNGGDVLHGDIREVSLVLAGANPGAMIDSIMAHGEYSEEEGIIYTDETIELYHSDEEYDEDFDEEEYEEFEDEDDDIEELEDLDDEEFEDEDMSHSDEEENMNNEETIQDVIDSMSETQQNVMYALIGQALDDAEEGGEEMKHNVFESDFEQDSYLTHADEAAILGMAKSSSVGSLRDAMSIFAEDNEHLAHSIDNIEQMFPEFKNLDNGEPETLTTDQTWIDSVINGTHKSPISRIRTRQFDARTGLRTNGYKKGKYKEEMGNVKLLKRTTDPQTIYVKDKLNRDDIIDITDFDVVNYTYKTMRRTLNEELALAIMVGDGRDEGDEMKISEDHIRSIWHDDDLYTIHQDVDIAKAKSELQGSDTSKNFGDNYVYAEAIITAALYSRENYKGSGSVKFYCTPHLLNVMLLARDLNGRRIYDSKSDLAAALNVISIETVEQFAGLQRTDSKNKKHELLGIFVNLADYQVGSTKGGEITRFNQFDIDFNQEKYLLETRLSGALTKVYSAIALELPVTE